MCIHVYRYTGTQVHSTYIHVVYSSTPPVLLYFADHVWRCVCVVFALCLRCVWVVFALCLHLQRNIERPKYGLVVSKKRNKSNVAGHHSRTVQLCNIFQQHIQSTRQLFGRRIFPWTQTIAATTACAATACIATVVTLVTIAANVFQFCP